MAQPDEKIVFLGAFSDPLVPTIVTGDCLAAFSAGFVDLARRFRRKNSRTLKSRSKEQPKARITSQLKSGQSQDKGSPKNPKSSQSIIPT